MEPILCMYSGGSDSTLAAAIAARRTNKVILFTLRRYGLFEPKRAAHNVGYLRAYFPKVEFEHQFDSFETHYRQISYGDPFKCAKTFDLRNASVCGLCKLGMHWKTIEFCKLKGIKTVFDGSVKSSRIFPEQNRVIMLAELEKLYWENGIEYSNPVFDLNTQEELFKIGIMPSPKIKGTKSDMQPVCSQQLFFAKYAEYKLNQGTVEDYERDLSEFYTLKIALLGKHLKGQEGSAVLLSRSGEVTRLKGERKFKLGAWLICKIGLALPYRIRESFVLFLHFILHSLRAKIDILFQLMGSLLKVCFLILSYFCLIPLPLIFGGQRRFARLRYRPSSSRLF